MSNLADRIYAVRLSIGKAAMEIENVDGVSVHDASVIFDSMTDLDEIESELRALLAERDALSDAAQYELKGWRLEHEDTSYFYLEDEEEVNSLIAEGYTAVPLYKKINTMLSEGERG